MHWLYLQHLQGLINDLWQSKRSKQGISTNEGGPLYKT